MSHTMSHIPILHSATITMDLPICSSSLTMSVLLFEFLPETPVGETDSVPSSPHSVSEASDEDCVEVEVSFSSFAIWWKMKNLLYY